jgi:GT2 family glycosyltransferase
VGGAFRLRIDSTRPALRLVAWGVQLRTRLLGMPYGDQALFVRREIFDALGGFRPLEIMEDTDFVRRLRKHGRITIVRDFVTTSDRRWAANGIMRTTLVNWAAALLFALGVPATRIRRFYDRLLVTA